MNEKQVLNFKLRSYKDWRNNNCVRAINEKINMEINLRPDILREEFMVTNLKNDRSRTYYISKTHLKIPKQYEKLYDSMKVYSALVKPEDEEQLGFKEHINIMGIDSGKGFARFTQHHHHIPFPTFEPDFHFNSEPAYVFQMLKSRKKDLIPSLNSFKGSISIWDMLRGKEDMSSEEEKTYYKEFEIRVIEKIKDKEKLCHFDFEVNKYNTIQRLNINKMLNLKIKRELEKEVI